jgi:glycyl-tRNA synthetase beta chain
VVALLGDDLVEFEIDGVPARTDTVGHRFHHPGPITIGNADDYAAKLRACHVIVDPQERMAMIREGAAKAAAAAGLSVVPDEGLVAENAGLTEWPVPLLGSFDPAFLQVPREVIQLTMRTNQKYFACVDGEGRLAPNFICTANITATDGGASIVAGNQKVLAARLSDAKFFWEQDLKIRLEDQAKKLDQIVFHEKLGTVADKVERVAKLARWLVEEGIVKPTRHPELVSGSINSAAASPAKPGHMDPGLRRDDDDGEARARLAQMAEDAARLAKADLVTGMVGEFPELQGVMGGYYARAQGLPDEVADAIRDHYKPVGQGDEVPTAPVTVAVSLADKLDTLVGFFAIGETPTGSRDPFALRRACLAIIQLILSNGIRCSIEELAQRSTVMTFGGVLNRAISHDNNFDIYLQKIWKVQPDRSLPAEEFASRMAKFSAEMGQFEVKLEPYTELVFDFIRSAPDVLKNNPKFVLDFFADRLKVQQREAGVRHDLIDAVFALGGEDDLVRLLARVKALQSFVATEDGANLLVGYRRAANILRKEGWDAAPSPQRGEGRGEGSLSSLEASSSEVRPSPNRSGGFEVRPGDEPTAALPDGERAFALSYTPEKEEAALLSALDAAEPRAASSVEQEDFEGAMAALASLRAPIDAFFDKVTVNDPDEDKRAARLAMLARIRDAVHKVADFSKIEG